MSHLQKTNDWVRKTQENIAQEEEYKKKVANKENISMFKVERRARTSNRLVPIHDVSTYDNTIYNFINDLFILD